MMNCENLPVVFPHHFNPRKPFPSSPPLLHTHPPAAGTSCSLCSCQGFACPYCHSCWLPYNTEEFECRCEPILHSRMVPPTHTVFIPSTSHFLHHTLFFLSSHSRAHTAFVLLRSSCCLLPLWFPPCWLFCWQTPAGCHGWDRGGILSV